VSMCGRHLMLRSPSRMTLRPASTRLRTLRSSACPAGAGGGGEGGAAGHSAACGGWHMQAAVVQTGRALDLQKTAPCFLGGGGGYLPEGHLEGLALLAALVVGADCRPIHVQDDQRAMVCDDAAPFAVERLQLLPGEALEQGPLRRTFRSAPDACAARCGAAGLGVEPGAPRAACWPGERGSSGSPSEVRAGSRGLTPVHAPCASEAVLCLHGRADLCAHKGGHARVARLGVLAVAEE